ncbi:MAG: hypothetical protein AAF480_20175 [Actinomycetota bacterium]
MATRLTPTQLDTPITGYGIPSTTLGELVDERLTLLVFLRHFG